MGKVRDGWSSKITFSTTQSTTEVYLYETGVTPPGLVGGGAGDFSTMRNVKYRTKQPKTLIDMSPASFVGAYSVDVYSELVDVVNVNQEITVTFGDGSTLTLWGWLDEFTPNEMVEGEMPTANMTVIPSNWNGSAESAPTPG